MADETYTFVEYVDGEPTGTTTQVTAPTSVGAVILIAGLEHRNDQGGLIEAEYLDNLSHDRLIGVRWASVELRLEGAGEPAPIEETPTMTRKQRTVHETARDISRNFAQAAREVVARQDDWRGTFIVTALFNETHLQRFWQFEPGAELRQSHYPVQVQADSPQAAAELAFQALNADDRPNGQVERSVSVADLLHVHEVGGENQIFIVERLGFRILMPADQLEHARLTGDTIRLRAQA